MATIRRVVSGMRAKFAGSAFENFLKACAYRQKWDVEHLPPCGGQYVGKNQFKAVPIGFDFIFCKLGKAIFADAKTTMGKTFSKGMIDMNQILHLIGKQQSGHTSGYIVNYVDINQVIFYPASQLYSLKRGESVSPKDGICIGNDQEIELDILIDDFQNKK